MTEARGSHGRCRIVLTGGPGGGKTTAADLFRREIGERVVVVRLRRSGESTFAQVDDGPEVPVALEAVRGVLWSLRVDEQRYELLARRDGPSVDIGLRGIGYRAEVMDEAHARLAQVAAARGQHADGFLLWNPEGLYSTDALGP